MITPVLVLTKAKVTYAAFFAGVGVIILQAVNMIPENLWGIGVAVVLIIGIWKWVKVYIEKLEVKAEEQQKELNAVKDSVIENQAKTIESLREALIIANKSKNEG